MSVESGLKRKLYVVYLGLVVFGIAIFSKLIVIQYVEGEKWVEKANKQTTAYKNIKAVRGNIYASDGSLLATSVPVYEVRMDVNAEALTDEIFQEQIDSLSYSLSHLFMDKSPRVWKQDLIKARNDGQRYYLIKRKVNYNQLKALKTFPLFKKGRYKGGFIYLQQNKRQRPFRVLAARTIGYEREGVKPVGLEGAYSTELSGVSGKRLMQKIAGGVWMPINDENEVEPLDGSDLYTTIDVNIQDVAENALLQQLNKHHADHGCVVVMEVETGEIKAIANLSMTSKKAYYESYNYAVGESTEPGSTFKLATLMAAMEDGHVSIYDSVDAADGKFQFYDKTMYDTKKGGYGKVTVKRAFEVSSNVAISRIINDSYQKSPQSFVDRLHKMNLNQVTGVEIAGEGTPKIKNASDKTWSGITLPWMSIGYEVSMTPLQILTFYNAIANDGVMVKPRLAKYTSRLGKIEKTYETEVVNAKICSDKTLKQARKMLEGVVENGTATNLRNANYQIAGKTGTAQIANEKYGYRYNSKKSYQASFCGYFPADNPKYSCIVVVNAPSRDVYYGNLVAGPIFKEIADKIYATSIEIHEELGKEKYASATPIPVSKNGNAKDLFDVFQEIEVQVNLKSEPGDWVSTRTGVKKVDMLKQNVSDRYLPNVQGMNVRDAVYVLENLGLQVEFSGKGVVKRQFPTHGADLSAVQRVKLELIS